MRTSTRCNRGGPQWRTRIAGSVKTVLTLCLLFIISQNLSAQTCTTCLPVTPGQITIDGSPCDWNSTNLAGVAIKQYTPDPFGNGVLDNQFTEGSKDFQFAADLRWVIGQTKAKNDIANSAVAIIGNTLYFAGDRTSNNGDAQIGFWFYLNGTGPVTQTDGTRNFAPEHAVGDILVLADFTGGGGTATTTVYKWVGDGTGNVPNTNGNLQTVDCPNAIVAENNGASYPHPNEFSFDSPCYAPNEFYEGAIPLSCIANATGNICFSSYLLETRSSQSITASLDDFVANSFTVAPTAVLTGGTITCTNPTVTLSTAGSSAGTYVIRGPAPNTTVVSGPVSAGGVYTLTVTNTTGCTSSATASVSVNNTAPGATATGGLVTCTTTSTTLTGGPAGFNYSWTGPGGFTSAVQSPTGVTAAGVYTLRVTNPANGCTSTATASVTVNTTPPIAMATGGTITCGNTTTTVSGAGSSTGAGFTYLWSGPGTIVNGTTLTATVNAAGTYTLRVTNTANGCTATATASVTKQNCNILVCSYTQGFWGNKNGLRLLQTSGILNTPIIIGELAYNSVTIPSVGTSPNVATILNDMMPGGSTPEALAAGDFVITSAAFANEYLTKQGKINNVLLSQTITLALNSRLNGGLLATIPLTSCILIDDSTIYLNQSVLDYMAGHGYPATVAGLLQLANAILSGHLTPGVGGVPSYSAINDAVTQINEGFDECKMFGGACPAPVALAGNVRTTQASVATTTQVDGLQVSAYPNPFNEVVKFTIQSKVSGKAQLEVYNMLGQKVKTVYSGFIQANKAQVVEFRAGAAAHQSLLYILKIGDNQVTGKLLNSRE